MARAPSGATCSSLPSSDSFVSVGRVGRPHGLAGGFVVEHASAAPERLAVGAKVYVDGRAVSIVESKWAGGRRVVRLDCAVARGSVLAVRRAELPPPEPDSYYVFDLLGLAVEEDGGRALGRVQQVSPGVANDVLELDSGIELPLVEACVQEVNLEAGRIVVQHGFADAR